MILTSDQSKLAAALLAYQFGTGNEPDEDKRAALLNTLAFCVGYFAIQGLSETDQLFLVRECFKELAQFQTTLKSKLSPD